MKKVPANWPRYMLAKRLRDGRIAYYWSCHKRDIQAGCTMRREALGSDYGAAIERAALLNRHLDSWRQGRDAPKDLDLAPDFGSMRISLMPGGTRNGTAGFSASAALRKSLTIGAAVPPPDTPRPIWRGLS